MTDFELVYMLNEYANAVQTAFMNYVALLSAFLIAGYLVSAKLKSNMVFIVVALFTMAVFQQAWFEFILGNNLRGAVGQIAERAAIDPSGLGWHGAALGIQIPALRDVLLYVPLVLEVIGYLGAMIFFFHQRRIGRAK